MFNLFRKHFLALLTLAALNTMNATAEEYYYPEEYSYSSDCCCTPSSNRIYIGGFGGEVFSNSTRLTQRGTAFFVEALGGPLTVIAEGRSRKKSAGFGGAQIGYEWSQNAWRCGDSNWSIAPAAEIEAFFYRHTKKGHLVNDAAIARLEEHDFIDTFPMNMGIYLFNAVISVNNPCVKFSPYIGGGIGAANIFIRKADSLQVAPPELGVNHFDSDRGDSAWTFAAQAKAGVRYNVWDRFHIFAEYRFLFVDSSRYTFGSTIAPGHPATSPWIVDVKDICYNAFAVGLRFDLY